MLKKYRLCSNSTVFIEDVKTGDLLELTHDDLKNLSPECFMSMTVNSFDVVDNILTLYVK